MNEEDGGRSVKRGSLYWGGAQSARPDLKGMFAFVRGPVNGHAKTDSEGSQVGMLAVQQKQLEGDQEDGGGRDEEVLNIRSDDDYARYDRGGEVDEEWRAEELYEMRSPRSRSRLRDMAGVGVGVDGEGMLDQEQQAYEMRRM